MDVLTQAFHLSGWETHHLMFPNVFYSVRNTVPFETGVKQLKSREILLPYVDSLMKRIPRFLFKRIQTNHCRSVSSVDWNQYDAIVLESGKPLFLQDLIPEDKILIYRQSDSVRYILGENPDYIALEDTFLLKAHHILVPSTRYKETLPSESIAKAQVIHNGVEEIDDSHFSSPYEVNTKNAIYIGLTPLHRDTVVSICRENPDISFHYFGKGLRNFSPRLRKNLKNLHDHGFVPAKEFLPFLKFADMFIFPFKPTKNFKSIGITTKYYRAMKYGLPIISYRMDSKEDFTGLEIDFCDTVQEFNSKVREIGDTKPKRKYNFSWERIKAKNILRAYREFVETL